VNKNLETHTAALCVRVDDVLKTWQDLAPGRPPGGIVRARGDTGLLTPTDIDRHIYRHFG
jgi:hypothetical protein